MKKALAVILQMLCLLVVFSWLGVSTVNVYIPEQSKASLYLLFTFGIDAILAMIVLCAIAIKDKEK